MSVSNTDGKWGNGILFVPQSLLAVWVTIRWGRVIGQYFYRT